MLEDLQNRKNYSSLKNYVESVLKNKKNVISIILFGSQAKGTYSYNSDFDLFIIIENEPTRFIDRLLELDKLISDDNPKCKNLLDNFNDGFSFLDYPFRRSNDCRAIFPTSSATITLIQVNIAGFFLDFDFEIAHISGNFLNLTPS